MRRVKLLIFLIFFTKAAFTQCSDSDPGTFVYKETFGGSFNSGNNGLALTTAVTNYKFSVSGSIAQGEYGIRKAIQNVNNWVDGRDHTGNNGFMMMVRPIPGKPIFLQKTVNNSCNSSVQSVCFYATSLNRSGSAREVSIRVTVTDTVSNNIITTFETPVLKNNDSIVWSQFTFNYTLPGSIKFATISFSSSTTTPVSDDFAIDDIRVMNQGGGNTVSSFFLNINSAAQYTYPFYVCLNSKVDFSIRDVPASDLINKMFQWERLKEDYSFEDIPNATHPYFFIDSAKRVDSRFYRLRIADSGNINSNGCYTQSYPIGLRVDPQPVILSNAPVCEGQELTLVVEDGTNVYWQGPSNFSTIGKRITIPATTVANSGKYVAKVVFTPGCSQTIDTSLIVNIKPNPIKLSLPSDTILCIGTDLILNGANNNATYDWSSGDTTASIKVKTADAYKLIVYKDGCSKQATVNVTALEKPFAFLRNDTTLCFGDTLILSGSQTNATGFHWSTGDTTQQIMVTKAGRYSLQARNFCGSNTAVANIKYARCYEELLLPTAFTPNRDGLNDIFKPVYDISVKKYRMNIYNRWGQVIFTSSDMAKGWDGLVNRLEQPTGAYIWQIEYTTKSGQTKLETGTVMLLK